MNVLVQVPMAIWLTVATQIFCLLGAISVLVVSKHGLARMLAAFVLITAIVYFMLMAAIATEPGLVLAHIAPTANKFFQVYTYYDLVNAYVNLIVIWLVSPFGRYILVQKNENLKQRP